MLEEWLYLRPRGENRGRKIDGEEVGVGWDTGTRRAEEEVGGGGDGGEWREVKRGQKEGKGRW